MFAGRLIRGVRRRAVPQWMQDWLKAVGLRPISALVDVTNFLSLDRGRPLHVYDAAKLKGSARAPGEGRRDRAGAGRQDLHARFTMVVIADDTAVLGIGGVGWRIVLHRQPPTCSGIGAVRSDLHRAHWPQAGHHFRTRATASSAASIRFTVPGELATRMIQLLCGGEPSRSWSRARRPRGSAPSTSIAHVTRLGGIDVPKDEQVTILNASASRSRQAG